MLRQQLLPFDLDLRVGRALRAVGDSDGEILLSNKFSSAWCILLLFLGLPADLIEIDRQVKLFKPDDILVSHGHRQQVPFVINREGCDVFDVFRQLDEFHLVSV